MTVINESLQAQYRHIHGSKSYGVSGDEFRPHIQAAIAEIRPSIVLNYGCGQTRLDTEVDLFGATYVRYDPGISEISKFEIDNADFLINTDVLEHIPEESLDDVLQHMSSISQTALINISTRPASEVLPDGSNAHCTIKTPEQWELTLKKHFPEAELVSVRPNHSCLFLTWKSSMKEVISLLNEVPALRKKLAKAERTPLESIRREAVRAFRKLRK